MILPGFIPVCVVLCMHRIASQNLKPHQTDSYNKATGCCKTYDKRQTTSSVTTDSNYGSVTDIDGNVYKPLKIGNQILDGRKLKKLHTIMMVPDTQHN